MVLALNYSTTCQVLDSWEEVRRLKNFEQVVGTFIFQELFQECPKAKSIFGFRVDTGAEELIRSKRFLMHAAYMVQMIDTALDMLGPDHELLSEIMFDLGAKHARYGVDRDMFSIMRDAIVHALLSVLKQEEFPQPVQDAWIKTLDALSGDMIRGMEES